MIAYNRYRARLSAHISFVSCSTEMDSNKVPNAVNRPPGNRSGIFRCRKRKAAENIGSSQNHDARLEVGSNLRIFQLNIEGISRAKIEILTKLTKKHRIDVVALQETHVDIDHQERLRMPGFTLLDAKFHPKHGLATYIRSDISNPTSSVTVNDDNCIASKIGDFSIYNIYRPPSRTWPPGVLPPPDSKAVFTGDFNSKHVLWGYPMVDETGEALMSWANANKLHLLHDAKQKKTFRSGRWNTETNPDLCFVTTCQQDGSPIPSERVVLNDFPHSQHRPSVISIGISIPITGGHPVPRWNLKKADWSKFQGYIEENISRIKPEVSNYHRLVGLILASAKKSIPKGFTRNYIPCWSKKCSELLKKFEESGDQVAADTLIKELNTGRLERWREVTANLDFKHSSRKAWSLIRRLGAASQMTPIKPKVTPNSVAKTLKDNSKPKISKNAKKEVKRQLRELSAQNERSSSVVRAVHMDEVTAAVKTVQNNKAPGIDGILPEFVTHLGEKAKKWLSEFFTKVIESCKLPPEWKESRIIALLKPGKEPANAKNYRPISLLCTLFKLFEKILLARIAPTVEEFLPAEQAGFRPNRSCTDQVLALTTHIERGYQKKLKTTAVLIDLTAAFDTVWKSGLLLKLGKMFRCNKLVQLFDSILSNRTFRVHLGDGISKKKVLNNGVPQGSVLSPVLFNIYTSDIPTTQGRKFMYADDIALAAQATTIEETGNVLQSDINTLTSYLQYWGLKPNPSKTSITSFHLNNKQAKAAPTVNFCGTVIQANPHPTYLGITLDRTLTFREHLGKVKKKITSRVNLLQKLAGSSWGSSANTLRTAALALVYSTAEYGAPVWMRSCHTHLVDTVLNSAMRVVTGCLMQTEINWLPVLSHIPPPQLRREEIAEREMRKISVMPALPIHLDLHPVSPAALRLKSRKPIWLYPYEAGFADSTAQKWAGMWESQEVKNKELVPDPGSRVPGFELPRKHWVRLNRFRTGQGRCYKSMHIWGFAESPNCECGETQTMDHIVSSCPLYHFPGGLPRLHLADEEAVLWLEGLNGI